MCVEITVACGRSINIASSIMKNQVWSLDYGKMATKQSNLVIVFWRIQTQVLHCGIECFESCRMSSLPHKQLTAAVFF